MRPSTPLVFLLAVVPLASAAIGAASGRPIKITSKIKITSPNAQRPTPNAVDFNRDIRPILAARCIACHGPKVQQNGLRLDLKTRALQGGDAGPLLTPGKSAESELIRRVTSKDPKKVMPPAGGPLPERDVALLRTWIDAGAVWPDDPAGSDGRSDHWAFQPVRRPAVPRVKDSGWVANPIDAFVIAALEKRGIRPSPQADRVTLIRRLSLDLTGLPPTPEEVDAFLLDSERSGHGRWALGVGRSVFGPKAQRPTPNADPAYDRLVDRLLASPHYGERWGRRWLDAARYADSNGYTIDSARSIWMYRDWVIQALNADMPFDRFTIEQLAGDMLPDAGESQKVATGFHRNTLINEEGGTDPEQFRVESVVDRVATTGSVFLGLTVGCAQCHSHKFDPISQKEYYQLYAFLNNADEPTLAFPTPEQARREAEVAEQLAAAQKKLAGLDTDPAGRQAEWERRVAAEAKVDWTALAPAQFRSAGGASIRPLEDGSLLVGGAVPQQDTYSVTADAPTGKITAIRLEAMTDESIPGRGPGFTPHGNFVLSEFEIAAAQPVAIARATADYAQPGMGVANAIDGNPGTGWGVYAAAGHQDRTAVFILKDPLSASAGARLTFTLKQLYPGPRYVIGRFRLSFTTAAPAALDATLPPALRQLLSIPPERRTREQAETVAVEFRKLDPERAAANASITNLQARQKEVAKDISSTMVMKEREKPRESHIMIRGDFLRKGAPVSPGVPAVLPPLPAGIKAPTRLDFARWLVDPRNPLTSRVTINRIWQAYFATGLVETENDFGKQGTPPSHPALLDWLAWHFGQGSGFRVQGSGSEHRTSNAGSPEPRTLNPEPYELGWSLKKLHRLIVTSNTYKQASKARPELAQVDPQNRLLARQSRQRLEAEAIRDVSLAASGLLSRKIGGPSVFPPQPAGLDAFTQNRKNWKPSEGEDRYRRGMYTFFWRSSPYAMFTTFDAPNGNLACTRRGRSNTPLGALMLANDQALFEMAQGLASRAMRGVPSSDPERIRAMFRLCLAREPTPAEAARLLDFYTAQASAFQAAPKNAEAIAPAARPAAFDAPHAAAWTSVARVLMNLDEFITRE